MQVTYSDQVLVYRQRTTCHADGKGEGPDRWLATPVRKRQNNLHIEWKRWWGHFYSGWQELLHQGYEAK